MVPPLLEVLHRSGLDRREEIPEGPGSWMVHMLLPADHFLLPALQHVVWGGGVELPSTPIFPPEFLEWVQRQEDIHKGLSDRLGQVVEVLTGHERGLKAELPEVFRAVETRFVVLEGARVSADQKVHHNALSVEDIRARHQRLDGETARLRDEVRILALEVQGLRGTTDEIVRSLREGLPNRGPDPETQRLRAELVTLRAEFGHWVQQLGAPDSSEVAALDQGLRNQGVHLNSLGTALTDLSQKVEKVIQGVASLPPLHLPQHPEDFPVTGFQLEGRLEGLRAELEGVHQRETREGESRRRKLAGALDEFQRFLPEFRAMAAKLGLPEEEGPWEGGAESSAPPPPPETPLTSRTFHAAPVTPTPTAPAPMFGLGGGPATRGSAPNKNPEDPLQPRARKGHVGFQQIMAFGCDGVTGGVQRGQSDPSF